MTLIELIGTSKNGATNKLQLTSLARIRDLVCNVLARSSRSRIIQLFVGGYKGQNWSARHVIEWQEPQNVLTGLVESEEVESTVDLNDVEARLAVIGKLQLAICHIIFCKCLNL